MNDSLINKATSLIDTGDINGSINLLNEILQNYPSDWKVHFNLACAYKTIGNYFQRIQRILWIKFGILQRQNDC